MDYDKLADDLELIKNKLWVFEKQLILVFWSLIKSAFSYLFMLWIYLWIYDVYGWERTLIALGVGVIVFNLRGNVSNVRRSSKHNN